MIISNMSIRKSDIARIFLEHPCIFEDHHDGEYLSIMIFVLHEMLKGTTTSHLCAIGDKSFWKPYFDVFPDADLPGKWTNEELRELEDAELMSQAIKYRFEIEEEWRVVSIVIAKYPDLFPPGSVTRELFVFVYSNVVTRCFGWSLPCTMLVPVADSLNHASVDASNEMINTDLQAEALRGSQEEKVRDYRTKVKLGLDISDLTAPGTDSDREPKKMAVKPVLVDSDVVTICKDMHSLTLKDRDYDIWNVYLQ